MQQLAIAPFYYAKVKITGTAETAIPTD